MASNGVTTWLVENQVEGRVSLRIGRRGAELIAEFTDAGQLTMSGKGTGVRFEPVAGADEVWLEKLRCTLVDAFVRHAQGKVTLHGGAISAGSKAVAFIGPSGSGKSTLTAALCQVVNIGIVADDTVAIEFPQDSSSADRVDVVPAQKAAWLLPEARRALGFDSATAGKTAIPLHQGAADRFELGAVIGLVFDSEATSPQLRRLRGQEAFSALFSNAIRIVVDDPAVHMREFDQLRLLVTKCPVYELRRPMDLSRLKHTVSSVLELLAPLGLPEAR
jgi:ABC-type dipeptide/oligopeptide/nickel transport system ATPase component